MNGNFLRRRALRAIAAAVCFGTPVLGQVSGSWVSLTGGSWSVGSNWSSNSLFPTDGGTASVGVASVSLRLDLPVTLQRVVFQGARGASISSAVGGTGSITLTGPGIVETTLNLRQAASFSTAAAPSISALSGTIGLTKTGPGLLVLSGGNYTGGTYVNQGTLASGGDVYGAAGASIVLNGGVLARDSGGTLSREISVTPAGGALFRFGSGGDLFFDGQLSGAGVFSFLGSGSLYLSADSPFTGTFRVGSSQGKAHLRQNGALRSVNTIALSGTLSLVNDSGFNSNRINDTANLLLNGGVLQLESSGTLTERVGAITLERSANYMVGSGTAAASELVRHGHAVLFTGPQVMLDTAPQLVGGGGAPGSTNMSIVPWATGGGLVTYQGGQLSGAPTRPDLSVGSVTTDNVRLGPGSYVLAAPTTINALVLNGTSFPNVSLSGSSTITISSGVIVNSAGNNTIAVPINFGSSEGFIHAYDDSLTILGPISGSGGLTISHRTRNSSANLFLSGASTYTGTTTFNDGTVLLSTNVLPNTPGPFGSDSSPIVLNDAATLSVSTVPSITFARDLIVRSERDDSTLRFPSTSGRIDFTGNVLVEGIFRPSSSTFSGAISGPGQIRIPSGASVTFSGDGSFTGDLWNSGSMLVGSDTALGTGRIVSPPMISGGFSVSTLTAINGPRSLANPLLIGNLTIAGAFPTTLTGPVQLNGGVTTLSVGAGTPQTTISGPISDGLLFFNGGRLFLVGNNSQYANTIQSGTVTMISSNALGGASGSPPLMTSVGTLGTLELFGGLVVPPHRLSLGSESIGLRSILGNSTWSGDVVRIGGTVRIAVDADALTIGGKLDLVGGAFEKSGNGSLIVGNLRTAGGATINGGTVRIRPNGTDAGVSNVASLSIAGGAAPTARLDLADNSLVINYTGSSPIDTIRAQILSGRAGGSWNGNGITGTFPNASTRTLGYGENSALGLTTFMGQTVDATSLIVRPTFFGDSDLDGDVDVNDLGNLASHWQASGNWTDGDFNYSGFVDAADLGLLASRWQAGVGNPLLATGAFADALAAFGLPSAQVPEPMALGLAVSALLTCHRRRRN